ncbi:MAG: DNA-protecting protein DprA [Clostridiales bacterium]|nr:DNA-protecting protein DprA [Clostridiales bacterium]
MIIEEKILVFLNSFDFLSHKKCGKIFDALNGEDFFKNFIKNYNKIEDVVSYVQFSNMYAQIDNFDNYLNGILKNGIKIITILSKDYPETLKNIDEPPYVLYCKGDISLLKSEFNLAIVGTRHPTNYGKQITEKFSTELTINGFNIVSGLADGVDTISHTACLLNKGKTIAVVAGGLDNIYPSGNIKLSEKICEKGLLISEKPPHYKAKNYDFPIRNRIIAGLSRGVLITEASLKSGTMHTKEYAINYGKELFVVPGNITSNASEGCNALIKDLRINMVTTVDDILKVFDKPQNKVIPKSIQLSIDEAIIFNLLKTGEKTFDEILINTNFDVKTLTNLLTMMSFRGIIKKLAGNIYSL